MGNFIQNNIQLLIVAIFILAPAIKGVATWLQQQAAKNKAELERKRRADELLRTGRPSTGAAGEPSSPSPAAATADADPEESFAARRRRQLEELRRREAAARQQREAAARQPSPPAGAPSGQVLVPSPSGAGGSPQPRPVPIPSPSSGRMPRPAGNQPTGPMSTPGGVILTPGPSGSVRSPRPTADRTPAPPIAPVRSPDRVSLSPLAVRSQQTTGRETLAPGEKLTRADLRRAIVLSEILAPPIASRPGGHRASVVG